MKTIMRTAYGSAVQTHLYTGIPFVVLPHTTLNQKLNILPSTLPPSNSFPQLRYFCIGKGGHRYTTSNGEPKITSKQHKPTDAAPFDMIPFVLREVTNDLTPTERARYGLRREENHNNKQFYAYYLRRIDYAKFKVTMDILDTASDGSVTTTPFVPNSSNLSPVPQVINPSGVNVVGSEHIRVLSKIQLPFTAKDCEELRNVGNIKFSDPELAVVSEVGLVSGVDSTVQIQQPGQGQITFNEVLAAQLCHISTTYHSPVISDSGFSIDLAIGSAEPMWTKTSP